MLSAAGATYFMADGVRPRAIPVKEMNPGRGQVFGHELVGGALPDGSCKA